MTAGAMCMCDECTGYALVGKPCRFLDRDVDKWVAARIVRWDPGENKSVTVAVGEGDNEIRYTVGKHRVRLMAAVDLGVR